MAEDAIGCQLVAVGDGAVGKTCLLITYATNEFPVGAIPETCDNYAVEIMVGDQPVSLILHDTGGECERFYRRRLNFAYCNLFLVLFSLLDRVSFENVERKWVQEIFHFRPGVPWILVGTKVDMAQGVLLEHVVEKGIDVITLQEGQAMAKRLGAVCYWECSAVSNENIQELFEEAIRVVISTKKPKKRRLFSFAR